jgi:hypothetical protein
MERYAAVEGLITTLNASFCTQVEGTVNHTLWMGGGRAF